MSPDSVAIVKTVCASARSAWSRREPYQHWLMLDLFPAHVAKELADLPFKAPSLGGISGKRELHNDTRSYFDAGAMATYPVMRHVAEALQAPETIRTLAQVFGAPLDDTFLRLEYAQDIDGFWLEPHTDLGVKLFTFLLYLSKDAQHADLGTDIYDTDKKHVGRSPFKPGGAMIFVPSNITYHGFEPRRIEGVRKSIIINYVSNEWKAREQLAFPDKPIKH